MSSRAFTVVDTPTLVLVQVEHGAADSFSRSVTPTATRRWNNSINRSTATQFTAYEFAVPALSRGTGRDEVCTSFAAFASSHENARAAITAHLDTLRVRA
jgi:hypothetical protein